jgi:hypothetical protein
VTPGPAGGRVTDLGDVLARAVGRPEPFAPHDALFWDDRYMGCQMLAAHLDPTTDAASGRPATIRRSTPHSGQAARSFST